MNATTQHIPPSRFHDLLDEVFGPVRAPRDTFERKLKLARSVVAYAGLISTLVQVVVWLTIGVLTESLDSPWWLWTAVPAAAGVAVLTLALRWRRWWTPVGISQEVGR